MNLSAGAGELDGRGSDAAVALLLCALIWTLNIVWLRRDTRPPLWDMALHQGYALNYVAPQVPPGNPVPWAARSGNYPPFVHLVIALCYVLLHPGPHVAALANLPATFLLIWSLYLLARDLAGARAALWTCTFTALAPFLIWISRETVLDYWLAAWVAAGLVALRKTDGFRSSARSLLFGTVCALGLLTKWFFAAFLFFPTLAVCVRMRIWRDRRRMIHLADALLAAGSLSSVWYLPNLPNLVRYFFENARVGALEGEPPVLSLQSFLYYLRLLEGYQLFGILFGVVALSAYFAWRRRLLLDGTFLAVAVCGGWVAMTVLRTKDPRFTLPLIGPLLVAAGAWVSSWQPGWRTRALKAALIGSLSFQAYAANFGVRWLPPEVILARGYQGSFRWDWNLYLQHYFHTLGEPRREDWKQEEIMRRVADDARRRGAGTNVALIPDLPRFNAVNFQLIARLRSLPVRVDHLRNAPGGLDSFAGCQYVILTVTDQGMPWSTGFSAALNRIVFSHPDAFELLQSYDLPDGNQARLYAVRTGPARLSGRADAI